MPGHRYEKRLKRSPYYLLKRAAQFAADVYMEHAGKDGLTQRQFTVLTVVEANEGVSQTQLVKLTGIDRSTLADMVSRLTAQGYLKRKRSKEDARTNHVQLTSAGRKALSAVQPNAATVDRKILAEIPSEHRKLFLDMLQVLAEKSSVDGAQSVTKQPIRRAKRKVAG